MTGMTSAPPKPPAPTCPPAYVGLCASCHHPTHRYGPEGNPLCVLCKAALDGQVKKRAPVGG